MIKFFLNVKPVLNSEIVLKQILSLRINLLHVNEHISLTRWPCLIHSQMTKHSYLRCREPWSSWFQCLWCTYFIQIIKQETHSRYYTMEKPRFKGLMFNYIQVDTSYSGQNFQRILSRLRLNRQDFDTRIMNLLVTTNYLAKFNLYNAFIFLFLHFQEN